MAKHSAQLPITLCKSQHSYFILEKLILYHIFYPQYTLKDGAASN